jgi:hypothetical protein
MKTSNPENLKLADEATIRDLLINSRVPIVSKYVMEDQIAGEKIVRVDIPPMGVKFGESQLKTVKNGPEEDNPLYEFRDPEGKLIGSATTYLLTLAEANAMIGYMNTLAQELNFSSSNA